MICKNCSAEYDDFLDACPNCSIKETADTADNKELEAEELTKESENEDKSEAEEPCEEALKENETNADLSECQEKADEALKQDEEKQEADVEKELPEENAETETDKADADNNDTKAEEKNGKTVAQGKRLVKTRRKTTVRVLGKPTKAEKRVSALVVTLVCFIGVLAVVLSLMNIKTDVFKVSDSGEKIVASVGFAAQEKQELEKLLAKCFSAAKKSYKQETADIENFLGRINPGDAGNIYCRLNNTAATLQTEKDPADRFADENGEYAYYKLEEGKVEQVLALFGLEKCHEANCKDYYYYDGYYYFAHKGSRKTPVVAAEITKSRRILDGSFYVECYFYLESNPEKAKTGTCYLILEKQFDETGVETGIIIKRISLKPMFSDDGNLIHTIQTYERKKEVAEGRTDNGKLFSKYTLEYPLINGEGAGYQNVKDFFKNAISVNEMKAESAQKEYEAFINNGGTDEQLPFSESIIARVAYEDEKNISIVGKITTVAPEANAEESSEDYYSDTLQQSESVKLGARSVEAYTFDKQSGNFVLKDSVIGKDHILIGELLYRIYNSYDYSELLDKESQEDYEQNYYDSDYEEIPEDSEGIGAKIYESAWSFTDDGVTFYYMSEKGYIEEVTLPYSVIEKLTA